MDVRHAYEIARYAAYAGRILEYGAGGSTLWLCAIAKPGARICSVEESEQWRSWVVRGWKAMTATVDMCDLDLVKAEATHRLTGAMDVVIVDGPPKTRADEIVEGWTMAKQGGVMAVHDSERYVADIMVLDGAEVLYDDFEPARREPCLWIGRKR